MEKQYFIVVDGSHVGPLTKDQLRLKAIEPTTLVWCQGMPDWQQAMYVAELADVITQPGPSVPPAPGANAYGTYGQPQPQSYYAMMGGTRIGPETPDALAAQGLTPDTPVWCQGMADWMPASTRQELMDAISRHSYSGASSANPTYSQNTNTYYGQQNTCNPGQNQGNPYYGNSRNYPYGNDRRNQGQPVRTNWMPWAICATVGGIFSCLGVIFGIIGIVQANNANSSYAMGNDAMGDQANRTARTMTIIALILDGIGLIGNISLFSSGTNLLNML